MVSVFVPEAIIVGMASLSVLTIIAAKKAQKRSTYGLLAIVISIVFVCLHYIQSFKINEALSTIMITAVIIVAAVITRQHGGDLTVVQVQ